MTARTPTASGPEASRSLNAWLPPQPLLALLSLLALQLSLAPQPLQHRWHPAAPLASPAPQHRRPPGTTAASADSAAALSGAARSTCPDAGSYRSLSPAGKGTTGL
jgi:hypothetical protein